jgi:hypothetical protein
MTVRDEMCYEYSRSLKQTKNALISKANEAMRELSKFGNKNN